MDNLDNLQTALELQEEGYSLSQIGEELGVSKSSVYRMLKQHKESLETKEETEETVEMDSTERSKEPFHSVSDRSNSVSETSQSVQTVSQKKMERSKIPSQDYLKRSIAAFEGYDEDGTRIYAASSKYEDDEPTEEVQEKKAVDSLAQMMDKETEIKEHVDEVLTKLMKTPFFRLDELSSQWKQLNKVKNLLEDFICRVTSISDTEDELYSSSHFLKKLLKLMKKAKVRLETWQIEQLKQDDNFYFGMVTNVDNSEETGVDFWKYQEKLKKETEEFLMSSLDIV